MEDLNQVMSNVADELPPEAIQLLIQTLQKKLVEKTKGAAGPGAAGPGPGAGLREAATARAGGAPSGPPGGPPPGLA